MSNVYTLKDIKNRGHQLGSAYEQELEKKLRTAIDFNSEITDFNEKLQAENSEYSEREKEFQRTYADIGNKISQLNASTTKVRSQLISERKSHSESQRELEAKYTAEIKSLKSEIKILKRKVTLTQKASSIDKDTILSLEAKVRELEGKSSDPKEIDSLRLELERVKGDLNSKNHEIECMEKGIEATHEITSREIDALRKARLNSMEENADSQNRHLKWKGRYRNSQNQIQVQNQNIFNLQQQILVLQNNPPRNMAAVHEIYQMLAPSLGQIPNYTGKETPDEYIQKITNIFESAGAVITAANNANANTFVDAQKCDILKSKMGEKFSPVPANDPYPGGGPINTPATFTNWLRAKYREVMAGNTELALQSLIQERFTTADSPDTYEARIRKLIVGFGNDQVLPAIYTHLPPDLRSNIKMYMTIRGAGQQTVDNFFADLRKCWVERQVGSNMISNQIQPQVSSQGATSAEIEKLNSQIASLQAQLAQPVQVHHQNNDALDKMYIRAKRLGLPSGAPKDVTFLDEYINDELIKRLGLIETHLAELSGRDTRDTESSRYQYLESSDRSNGGLEKRLGQIETHIAKLTRGTKSSQRQRSESSTLNNKGLEKRLGQIEAYLAKLTRNSKSKSGRIHMATVDEQSNSGFFDNDNDTPSKPEDDDLNSDSSSAESDSGNRDMDIHITYGKKNQGTKRVSLEGTIRKIIQSEFEKFLPYIIQQVKKCEPVSTQDKSVKSKGNDDLEPVSVASKSDEKIPELSDEEDVLDDPMEIDFVRKKKPSTSIASIKCKIGRLKIPAMALDSCSEIAIITEDIVLCIKAVIDRSIKHDLSGVATVPVESIGVVHNLPITLVPGFTIYEDFIVVKYSKPMLIFSNPLLKKYKCAIDWDKDELKIPHNGKDVIIPVTMHKVKNKLEVNCANVTPECDNSMAPDCISHDLQDLSHDDSLKKK
ncbi:hypothetical protein RclHR1_02040011 [Rhizophagus clarus]|uniref:Uncharacterized protein n=1 Tax=Rhizophagus clarus TaxID=94130 RepID=A0A2Z6R3R2_9GLOM|nr:hypothetical protein RclHR1_02040011 [Rhizophagus clarus]